MQGLEGYLQGRELVGDDAKSPEVTFDASAEGGAPWGRGKGGRGWGVGNLGLRLREFWV